MSFNVVDRPRTDAMYAEMKSHVQSVENYCFSSLNMQICGVLVNIVVVAKLSISEAGGLVNLVQSNSPSFLLFSMKRITLSELFATRNLS